MFGTYLKQSLWTLPFIVLFPIVSFVLYVFVIEPYYIQYAMVGDEWLDVGQNFLLFNIGLAVFANLLFLLIIPAIPGADGGHNTSKKRAQFYIGLFANFGLMLIIPIIPVGRSVIDGVTFAILIALDALAFLIPFILGASFVSPAYRRAFWFAQR
jgi:hypothetical protein